MPTLANGSGALRINVPKGSSLIIRNQSGVETVTGSSASREDAAYALGANAFVYGPQTASSDVSISTTGVLTYDIVAGDPTPASVPAAVSRNATTGQPSGLIDPATGQAVGGGGGAFQGASIAPVTMQSVVASLPKFKAALQLTAQRKKPTIVLVDGDSTEAGYGVNTGTNGFAGARKMTHAAQLARMLGWQDSGTLGMLAGNDVTPNSNDERISPLGAGVTVLGNVSYMGGLISFANGASGAYTITPRGSKGYDRVRVIYGSLASGGATNMSVNVGGTSIGTFSAAGSDATQSIEFSCPYSDPSVPISISGNGAATNGQCFIQGVIWWDSADPGVIVLNSGSSGSKVLDRFSQGNKYTFRNSFPALAPDLVIENLWINDTLQSTDPSSYQGTLSALKTMLNVSADVVWMGYQPINSTKMTDGQGDAIFAAMKAVAGTDPVIDLRATFGQTFAEANALGVFVADGVHINSLGQYYKACYTASAVAP